MEVSITWSIAKYCVKILGLKMKRNNVLSIIPMVCAVLACSLSVTTAERIMRPKMKDMKTWSDNVYVTHALAFDAADPHINISISVLQELHDVDLHIEGNVVQKIDPNYFITFNTTMNVCRILNWRNASPVGTLIHAYLKEYGNLVETCPIAKGEYYMHKFYIPEDTSTALLPEFDFDFRISAFHVDASKKRTLIADDHLTGEGVVQDVNNVKRGILAMLPKAG